MITVRTGSERSRHKGLHTLEMAILMPLLFAMVAVALDFSIYLFASARFEIIATETVQQATYGLDESSFFEQFSDPSSVKWSKQHLGVFGNRTRKLIHSSPDLSLKHAIGLKKQVVLSYDVVIKTPFSGLYTHIFKDFRRKTGQIKSAEVSPFKTMTRSVIVVEQVVKVDELPAVIRLWQQAFIRIGAWIKQVNL